MFLTLSVQESSGRPVRGESVQFLKNQSMVASIAEVKAKVPGAIHGDERLIGPSLLPRLLPTTIRSFEI